MAAAVFNDSVYEKNFPLHKQKQVLENVDLSRKASFDEYIGDLILYINSTENFFTTSSCSGRFIVYSQSDLNAKKDCKWIYVTHEKMTETDVNTMIESIEREKAECNEIYLKFEPFILHVCCKNMNYAKLMLDNAISNGFKNSGISVGSSKIILAARCTQNLSIPITSNGRLLVDLLYLKHVCNLINEKFEENFRRIDKFYEHLKLPESVSLKNEVKEKGMKKSKTDIANKENTKSDTACMMKEELFDDVQSLFD